jgi:tetratricopeptide (TPR) repeat protein
MRAFVIAALVGSLELAHAQGQFYPPELLQRSREARLWQQQYEASRGSSGGSTVQPGCGVINPFGYGYGYGGNPFGYGYGVSYLPYAVGGYYIDPYAGGLGYPLSYSPTGRYIEELNRRNTELQQELELARSAGAPRAGASGEQAPVRVDVPIRRVSKIDRAKNFEARAREKLIDGDRFFQAGQFARALEAYRSAGKLRPEDSTSRYLTAVTQFALRSYDASVAELKAGLKLNADWIESGFNVKTLFGNPDWYADRLAELAREVKKNPHDADRTFLLGFILFSSGELDMAQPVLEQAARLSADDGHLKPFFDYFAKLKETAPAEEAAPTAVPPTEIPSTDRDVDSPKKKETAERSKPSPTKGRTARTVRASEVESTQESTDLSIEGSPKPVRINVPAVRTTAGRQQGERRVNVR